jgi:hypothetical protein
MIVMLGDLAGLGSQSLVPTLGSMDGHDDDLPSGSAIQKIQYNLIDYSADKLAIFPVLTIPDEELNSIAWRLI